MSKLDRLLIFVFSHQTVLIELIFAIILGIVVVWLFTHLRAESGEEVPQGHDLNEIEEVLRRVLQGTDFKMTAAQAVHMIKDDDVPLPDMDLPLPGAITGASTGAVPTGAAGGASASELAKLRSEVDLKGRKLSELEKALSQAKEELAKAHQSPAGAAVNTDELQKKIQSLESRLAEYEIIEDDIANLSLYKEENIKLKAELEKFRRGGAPGAPAPAAEPAANSTPASTVIPVTAEPAVTEAPPAAAPQAPSTNPVDQKIDSDKLLKEFDTLVAQEASKTSEAEPAVPAAPAAPVETPMVAATPTPAAADEKESGDKLIEEFENFMKGNNG